MNKPLTIVIPMAGQGSRFAKEGWIVPKPLIEFGGKMMIEHVLDAFPNDLDARFVLIIREDYLRDWDYQMDRLRQRPNVEFVTAKRVTQGAACSVLLARQLFKDSSLLVADSDTFYRNGVLGDFIEKIRHTNPDLGLITFQSNHNCYSYVKLTKDNKLERIAEKQVISEHAISGVYYFSDGDAFENAIIEAMIYDDRDKGEFYLSKIFGNLGADGKAVVLLHEINREDMLCTGTPAQLQDVIQRLEK